MNPFLFGSEYCAEEGGVVPCPSSVDPLSHAAALTSINAESATIESFKIFFMIFPPYSIVSVDAVTAALEFAITMEPSAWMRIYPAVLAASATT